jgi:hypothetical protein
MFLFAQTEQQKSDLQAIKDFYKVEGSNVVFTKVIDDISATKEEIFTRAVNFFAIAYKSANDVIQQKDKEAGIVIGKGIFEVYKDVSFLTQSYWNCNHTIRIDVKDGRARVVLSVSEYDWKLVADKTQRNTFQIADTYPINENSRFNKKTYSNVFLGLYYTVSTTFKSIEKSLKEDTAFSPGDDW